MLVYVAYSAVRNQFGSGAGDAVDPEPAFHHGEAIIQLERNLRLYFEDACSRGTSTCRPTASSGSGTSTTASSTSWSPAFALVWLLPGQAPERYRVWRNTLAFTTLLALVGFAIVLADATAAARRPGHLRRLPGLRRRPRPTAARGVHGGRSPLRRVRLRRHRGRLRRLGVVRQRRDGGGVQPVRRDAEHAHRLVDLVCARARPADPPPLAAGARHRVPAAHAVRHHGHRQPLLDRRPRRPGLPGRRLPVPAAHDLVGAVAQGPAAAAAAARLPSRPPAHRAAVGPRSAAAPQ